jgi:putative protein-disulfide isomerase
MKKVQVLYVYDPLCGWCFGFGQVIKRLYEEYAADLDFDIISGGMMVGEREGMLDPQMGAYILGTIPRLEEYTGVAFGEVYKQQVASGTLYQSSVKPSVALSVFKTYYPAKGIAFASSMQQAQFVEGKSLEADETYIELFHSYDIKDDTFLVKLNSEEYRYAAYQEFNYAKELGVTGFPAVIAVHKDKYYSVSRGYQSYENLKPVFDRLKTFD